MKDSMIGALLEICSTSDCRLKTDNLILMLPVKREICVTHLFIIDSRLVITACGVTFASDSTEQI